MKFKKYHSKPRPPSHHDFFDILMFSDQKEIKYLHKDKDKDITV